MKIAIIGYGKMGRMIEQTAIARGHEIVSKIDVNNPEEFDSPAFASADVAIEFTNPTVAYDNCRKAFERGVKVVSGSTGWLDDHKEEMEKWCREGGKTLFWASNFSLGVAIFAALNRQLAMMMNKYGNYDVSMEETHHIHKLDAPSGTAITLAEDLVVALDRKDKWVKGEQILPDGTTEGSNEVAPNELPISSVRRDEVAGIHSIRYNSEADEITITHSAHNRSGFAMGAVLAAEYAKDHNGMLTMKDLLGF